jgi:subtilisin-like proprotein convertase family protein
LKGCLICVVREKWDRLFFSLKFRGALTDEEHAHICEWSYVHVGVFVLYMTEGEIFAMKSRRGLIFSGVSLILCAVLWTAAVGAQAGIYARSTKVLPHTGYSAEGLPLTIPDLTTVESPLEVSEAVTVEDVNVLINLTHTYDGDLQIALVSPSGTEVILANHVGGSGNNFTNTVFDDEAMSPIGSGAAPFTGAFQPSQPLAGLDGTTCQGTWRLVVRDQMGSDTGVLLNWRLILNAQSDLVDSYHYVPDTSADWLVTDGRLRAGIGEGHPAHNSASINLADFNWSLNPAKRQNWSLDVAKRNEWGGWMDLNRPAVSGWLEGRYSCAYVLACDKADFTDPTARGYAIGFKAGGSSPLVLFRFDAGINSGALQLPASTTEIVQSGYNYLDSDDGVNFYVQLMPDGRWAVRWKSGSVLPTESVFEATSYTAQAMSTVTDTTYQGYDFKYAGWVYAHSVSSLAYAYFDNLGAGLTANDFNAPALGTFDAPAYAKAPFSVSYAGVTDNRSGVAQVELWARHESQTEWAQAGVLASASGSFPVFPNQGDGVYGFSLVMVDRDGNRSAEPTSVTAPLDTTLFDTTAPVAGPVTATLYSSTSLEVAYSGTTDTLSGLASAQLWYSYNDQNSWTALSGMTTSTSSAVFTLTPSTPSFTLNEGVYYWGFVVTDNAGNTTSTASGSGVAISYFDTTPPTSGSLLAPQYATGGPIAVSYGGFLDAISGLREVQLGYRFLDVTTPTWVFDPIYTTASATGEFLFNPTLGDGTYEFQVRAWDNAGNSVQAASSVQTILDSVAPIPGILSMPAAFFYKHAAGFTDLFGSGRFGQWTEDDLFIVSCMGHLGKRGAVGLARFGSDGYRVIRDACFRCAGGSVFSTHKCPLSVRPGGGGSCGNVSLFPGLSEYGDVWFHEDTVAPNSGTVSAPEYANTAPFSVSYSGVMDSFSGVTTVTLYSNSWSNPIGTVWYLDSGSVSYTPPSDGLYTFGLRASDLAENMAENPTSVTTIYDTTAPTTAALSVAALTSGTVIPVTCTTFPEDVLSGVERVELWYNVNGTTWTASGLTIATTGTVVNFTRARGSQRSL